MGGGKIYHHFDETPGDVYFPYSINHELQIVTATALYRNEVYQRIPKLWQGKDWKMRDTPLWIELSKEGRIKYFKEVTSHYRVLESSASHGDKEKEIAFINNAIIIHQYYANYYGVNLYKQGYDRDYYLVIEKIAYKHKDKNLALNNLKTCYNKGCLTIKTFLFYLFTVVPPLDWFVRKRIGYIP